MQQADARAASAVTIARSVERRAARGLGVRSPAWAGMERGAGGGAGELGVSRRGDEPSSQRDDEAYAMRTTAKTNAKTNVTSIITAPEKRKTSESSITRFSA